MTYMWRRRQYRNIYTGKVSPFLYDACEDMVRLTLDPDFVCSDNSKWFIDPFIEVVTYPPQMMYWPKTLESMSCENIQTVVDCITTVIELLWEPDKFHLIWHSSGYDSRIISGILKRLKEKHGKDWLGDILFLSNRWEADNFYKIMEAQGWDRSQYAAYDEGPEDEHFGVALDFDTFWYEANAPVPMPGRFWYYVVKWAQGKGLLPDTKDIQPMNGQGAGYWGGHAGVFRGLQDFKRYFYHEYYSETTVDSPNGMAANTVLSHTSVMEAVFGYDVRLRTGRSFASSVSELVSPETKDIDNMGKHDHMEVPISRKIQDDCKDAFDGSWYAKEHGIKWEPPETAMIDRRWGQWGLASLCEHLIKKGVEICVA